MSSRSIIFSILLRARSLTRKWLRAIIRKIFFVPTSFRTRRFQAKSIPRITSETAYRCFLRAFALKNNAFVEGYPRVTLLIQITAI